MIMTGSMLGICLEAVRAASSSQPLVLTSCYR